MRSHRSKCLQIEENYYTEQDITANVVFLPIDQFTESLTSGHSTQTQEGALHEQTTVAQPPPPEYPMETFDSYAFVQSYQEFQGSHRSAFRKVKKEPASPTHHMPSISNLSLEQGQGDGPGGQNCALDLSTKDVFWNFTFELFTFLKLTGLFISVVK